MRFKSPLTTQNFLGDLHPVIIYQSDLPHRVVVRLKWEGEYCVTSEPLRGRVDENATYKAAVFHSLRSVGINYVNCSKD